MDTIQPWDGLASSSIGLESLLSKAYPVTRVSGDSAFEPDNDGQGSGDLAEQALGLDQDRSRLGSLGERSSKLSANTSSKNRAAQKRYRERQKGKMETYKQQVDELNKRLSELQTENESLENRNRLLEKVVQMRDQKQPSTSDPVPPVAEEAAGSIWQNTNTYVAVADYVNAIKKQRQPLTTPQEAAHISPEDLRQIRVDYVKELAKLLLAHGDEPGSEGFKQLEDYVLQARLAAINLLNSMSVRSFAHVLALKKRMILASHVSERLMAAMNLSSDQKRDYIKARQSLIARNEEIKKKRRRIVSNLELAVPSIAPLMCGQTVAMLQACESSDQFKASLEDEHQSMSQFHIDCVQVLTPLQEARSLLEAHPGNPDPWLISGFLEAEQKGKLTEWLRAHNNGHVTDPSQCNGESEPGTTSSGLSSSFSEDLNRIAPSQPGARPHLPYPGGGFSYTNQQDASTPHQGQANQQAPMQSSSQGMQDLLAGSRLDTFDPAPEGMGTDDMWLDFFPGLLTQSNIS